jgi:hypothetical protein
VTLDYILTRTARTLAYIGLAAIVVLSLIPSATRPHTGAGGDWEHLIAYLLVGLAFGFGYRSLRSHIWTGMALAAGSGGLELLQNLVPGRSPEWAGFLSSSAGAIMGLVISGVLAAVLRRMDLIKS